MEVSGLSSSNSVASTSKSTASHQSNFMTLLVAQLQNQDPLNPASNEDFIAQLAQLESLDESKKISASLSSMVSTQEFSAASTMIGKSVSGRSQSIDFNGVVSSVSQIDGKVKLNVTQADGSLLQISVSEISQIMQ